MDMAHALELTLASVRVVGEETQIVLPSLVKLLIIVLDWEAALVQINVQEIHQSSVMELFQPVVLYVVVRVLVLELIVVNVLVELLDLIVIHLLEFHLANWLLTLSISSLSFQFQ